MKLTLTPFPPRLQVAFACLVSVILSCPSTCLANDGSVEPSPSGGLIFEKNTDIRMLSEDLHISLNTIEVNYVFKNISSNDVTIKIEFTLAPIDVVGYSLANSNHMPHDQDFKVWVDGKEIASNINIKVFTWKYARNSFGGSVKSGENDFTQEFMALGLDPFDNYIGPKETAQRLRKLGLVCSGAELDENEEVGCWSVRKTYFWDQTFPAGKEIKVRHTYSPWAGGAFTAEDTLGWSSLYCMDKQFSDAVTKKLGEKNHSWDFWNYARIEYILKTGDNWSGPIGKFNLQIDKGGAALISYCPIPGLTLTKNGNYFVGSTRNFTPTSDLDIIFFGHDQY